jgi:NADH:ubiquinone oxidoreductase subunit C
MSFIKSKQKFYFFCIQKSFLMYLKCSTFYFIRKLRIKNLELEVQLAPWHLYPVITFVKKTTMAQFQNLLDIIVYDTPKNKDRFTIIYLMSSTRFNRRLFISTKLNELTPLISINSLYITATWIEREIWDLFGIIFLLHKDLRRILTEYGFEFHPLRKDFPITGFCETLYDETQKRITSKSFIGLAQRYRVFKLDFN